MASVRMGGRPKEPSKLGIVRERSERRMKSPFEPVEWREGQKLVEAVWRLSTHERFLNRLLRRDHPAIDVLNALYSYYTDRKEFDKASFIKTLRDTLSSTVEGNRLLPAEEAMRLRMALIKLHRIMKGASKRPPETWPFEEIWAQLRFIDSILGAMAEKRKRGVN